jgi:hypothetical protein
VNNELGSMWDKNSHCQSNAMSGLLHATAERNHKKFFKEQLYLNIMIEI